MKKLFLITSLLALCSVQLSRAQDEPADEEAKEGKVHYALILPEEKTPELVKPNEASPFGGLVDDKSKETASGEEAKVGNMLRSLPVVGKSSRNCVLLGDIILRKGEVVPPILPNQTVQLYVRDITPDQIELVWIEKKPTGLNPRTLMITTDVTPQVMQQLPGNRHGDTTKGGSSTPVMGVINRSKSLLSGDPGKPAPRAQPVLDETPSSGPTATTPGGQTASGGSALLNLFFGNQVKEPVNPGAPKPVEEEEEKPDHVAKP